MNHHNGFAPIFIIIAVAVVAAVIIGIVVVKNTTKNMQPAEQAAAPAGQLVTVSSTPATSSSTSTKPSITVISPNGGEAWYVLQLGSSLSSITQTVSWSATAVPQAANGKVFISLLEANQGIVLSTLGTFPTTPGINSAQVVLSSSTITWLFITFRSAGQYRIRVNFSCPRGSTEIGCSAYDDSAPFSIDIVAATPAQTNIDTSNWQTYRNEKYGFEVKYPPGLVLDEGIYGNYGGYYGSGSDGTEVTVVTISNPTSTCDFDYFSLGINEKTTSTPDDLFAEAKSAGIMAIKRAINGMDGVEIYGKRPARIEFAYYDNRFIFRKGGALYTLNLNPIFEGHANSFEEIFSPGDYECQADIYGSPETKSSYKERYDRVLSTFKFTQ